VFFHEILVENTFSIVLPEGLSKRIFNDKIILRQIFRNMGVGRIFFQGGGSVVNFSKRYSRGSQKCGEICFFPLDTKKKNFN